MTRVNGERDPVVPVDAHAGGLTAAEAAARLAADGPNVTPTPPPPSMWRHLLARLTDFFARLLWGAAMLAVLGGLPALAVAIVVVVLLNGGMAFLQEYRAERAATRLRDLLPRRTMVLRDGQVREVPAEEVVVGDLLLLEAGDRIAADGTVVSADGLAVDVSSLTGESVPAHPGAGDALHAGCHVTEGTARCQVAATGAGTRLAGIAALTRSDRRPPSPLTVELHRLVRVVAAVAIGVGVTFAVVGVLLGMRTTESLIFGVGVTVALVPEALLPTVTLSLAIGGERLAARHALVRRLESVETLGSVSFICTDKTGTLTTNRMSVVEVWTPAGRVTIDGEGYGPQAVIVASSDEARAAAAALALAGARCSTASIEETDEGWIPHGDTMEAAIVAAARRFGEDQRADTAARPEVRRWTFDPRRRRMSVALADGALVVKGAADSVLPRCLTTDGDGTGAAAVAASASMTARGLRVLAVATREGVGADAPADPDDVERGLRLLGFVGLLDPPRPTAAVAVAACRRAGIRVAMITGDHPATAAAVAQRVGLIGPEPGDGLVLEGRDLPGDSAVLGALIDRDGVVIARVAPEDKLRILMALQERGQVVAMTGDGVNDGPALAEADIGVAMGRTGTDVAREAADLVLLEEDLGVIVTAIEQGRATFANIRRFLTYHLTDNVAELSPFVLWAISGGRFPLIIGVLQVLALDIATDTLPAVALGGEAAEPGTLDRPPERRHLLDGALARRAFVLLGPTEAVLSLAAFLVACWAGGWRWGDDFPTGDRFLAASGAAFLAIVVAQLTNAFLCRSETVPPWRLPWRANRLLPLAVAIELGIVAAIVFVAPIGRVVGHAAPPAWAWTVIAAGVPVMVVMDTVAKLVARRRSSQ